MTTPRSLIIMLAGTLCQSCYSQPATKWGAAVAGVRLSITLSNTVVATGSNVTLVARIQNSSTNAVAIGDTGRPLHDLDVSLVSSTGKKCELRPKGTFSQDLIRNGWIFIAAGTTYEKAVTLRLDRNVEEGALTVLAKQSFLSQVNGKLQAGSRREIISNPLEIHVEEAGAK